MQIRYNFMEQETFLENESPEIIRVTGLKKRYRLGRIGAGTLQSTIKEWKERRKDPERARYARRKKNEEFYALDGIDFRVRRGETVGIIGKNGAGKSTLLKILSRITAPTEGVVDLYGRVASMLEVGTGFHGDMTGRENIYLNGAILGMTKAEIDKKMDDIIRFSEIEDFIDTPIKRYSSGMYVKLGFSVAYHLDSEIIIMDEVLAVGDIEFQRKCLSSLAEAAKDGKRTVLYVSHNMNTVRQLCNRCIVLDKGKIIFDGDTERAIEIYLNIGSDMPVQMNYGPEHRPDDRIIRAIKRFSIDSMVLADRMEPVFRNSEEAVIKLTCTAFVHLKNVGFRFEIWYQDNTKVAAALSESFLDFSPGTETVTIRMPLRHLESGRYRADIMAFLYDGTPNDFRIDAVYPGFYFQIEPVIDSEHYLKWDHRHWGAIRLDNLRLERSHADRETSVRETPEQPSENGIN